MKYGLGPKIIPDHLSVGDRCVDGSPLRTSLSRSRSPDRKSLVFGSARRNHDTDPKGNKVPRYRPVSITRRPREYSSPYRQQIIKYTHLE